MALTVSPFAQGLATLGGVLGIFIALALLPTPAVVQAIAQYILLVILLPAYLFSIIVWLLLGRGRRDSDARGPRAN